jgi:hypothetical protein
MNENSDTSKLTLLAGIKAHPWITGIFVFCVILWTGLALTFLPEEWNLLRKIGAGIIWGLFCGIIVTATRTVGNETDQTGK